MGKNSLLNYNTIAVYKNMGFGQYNNIWHIMYCIRMLNILYPYIEIKSKNDIHIKKKNNHNTQIANT